MDEDSRRQTTCTVDVWTYDPKHGIGTWWEDDAVLRAEVLPSLDGTVIISGNPAGLVSLARHLLTLAHESVPGGRHFDFETYNGLAPDSRTLRVEVEK
ncbi:hypothetical protein I0C86_06790 [Plantactinospora sp. S1510]|uniref:Uncharacterized protein n=1 Tax=Plantactinospora alkalitolerans TaxID=2789879 RepID=A0ABS0GR86_9ACTN|nr:hypothetical protein [Plantactinospora alkalitolerans]MBF9128696.1 hypothetical protein [Plantactinospora alkalitolerans]